MKINTGEQKMLLTDLTTGKKSIVFVDIRELTDDEKKKSKPLFFKNKKSK